MAAVTAIRLAYNSVYLHECAGGRTLIDAGPDYLGAWDEIASALAGRLPLQVLATHGHLDHAGLGSRWQGAGIPVALGRQDVRLVTEGQFAREDERSAMGRFIRGTGAPAEVLSEALAGLEAWRLRAGAVARSGYAPSGRGGRWPTALRLDRYEPEIVLDGDASLESGLEVISCPGHTPGNFVVYDPVERWLFSGDQLLPDLTPTPAIQWCQPVAGADWRFRSLPAFVRSLERLRRLDIERCFPGHGEPFGNVGALIDANLDQVGDRVQRAREALRGDSSSLWALCERLYPRAARRRFWQIVATVQGLVDLVECGWER